MTRDRQPQISTTDRTHARTGPDKQRAQAHNHTQNSNPRTQPRRTSCPHAHTHTHLPPHPLRLSHPHARAHPKGEPSPARSPPTSPQAPPSAASPAAAPAGPPQRQPRWRRRHHQPQSRYPLLARSEFVVVAHRPGYPSLGHVPTPRPRMRERTKAMNGTQSSCVGGWSRSRVSSQC